MERPTTGREEFARGWPILIGALVCYAISIVAIPVYTNGVFLKVLAQAFHASRGQLPSVSLISTAVMMVTAPLVGMVADRVGVRLPIGISLVGMAGVYLLMGTVMNSLP